MSQKKIALVGFHLYGGGGARVMAILSNYFHNQNIEVHNIILHNELGFDYSGALLNLGELKSERNTIFNKIKRFVAFKKYTKKHNFDFIIDFRFRKRILQEYLISRFIYKRQKTIYTIHSSKLEVYLPKATFWTNIIYCNAYKVLALTKEMEQSINIKYPKLLNVSTIFNPIEITNISLKSKENIDLGFEFIIGAGSFDVNIKQFDKLIIAYAKSALIEQKIHLLILGRGKLLEYLKTIAINSEVSDFVHFLGYDSNPYKYFSKAKYFVLSSLFEGLPMVVLEALACGTPVISFDCPTGPKEIISHKENGLLIEDQNIEALTEGMNTMLSDNDLYEHCKNNALKSVSKFSVDTIGEQWLELMNFKN